MLNVITLIREKFNISQSKMAIETGLSREYINKVEKGKLEISEKNISLLRDIYGDFNLQEPISEKNVTNEEIDNSKESLISLNETSVHSIIETNRNISRTLEKMVDTNAQFALLLKSIIPVKTETYQGVHQDTLSKLSQILEYVVEIGSGKRWETKEDGIVELNKRFFGSAEVLQEKDNQSVKDK